VPGLQGVFQHRSQVVLHVLPARYHQREAPVGNRWWDERECRQRKLSKALEYHSDSAIRIRSHSNTDSLINPIGRDNSISCLLRYSRSDYGAIASLNRSFWSLIRTGELYQLRRKNKVIEHWRCLRFGQEMDRALTGAHQICFCKAPSHQA
jgi:hypothetical protein